MNWPRLRCEEERGATVIRKPKGETGGAGKKRRTTSDGKKRAGKRGRVVRSL